MEGKTPAAAARSLKKRKEIKIILSSPRFIRRVAAPRISPLQRAATWTKHSFPINSRIWRVNDACANGPRLDCRQIYWTQAPWRDQTGRSCSLHLHCGEFADLVDLAHGFVRDKRPEKRRPEEVLDVSSHAVRVWMMLVQPNKSAR